MAVPPITDATAKAVAALATFGTTVVTESSNLARYVGTILGTVPHDAVGIVLGEPLHAVRTLIAGVLHSKVQAILERRNVKETQPVSPSVAIPLIRAAYDESRAELQDLWAALIAAAMDPARADRVRLSFIETLKQFDPLDAMTLKLRTEGGHQILQPNAITYIATTLKISADEVQISADNLWRLKCVDNSGEASGDFLLTRYGHALLRACLD